MTTPTAVTEALRSLIAEARREYRDTDAAGDVLDWLEERTALAAPGPDEGAEAVATAGELVEGGDHTTATFLRSAVPPGTKLYTRPQSPAQPEGVHTCSYACQRPDCIKAQRDELAARHAPEASAEDAARLDYIERTFSGMTNRERYLPVQMIWGKGAMGRTLREACDKYMQRDARNGNGGRDE